MRLVIDCNVVIGAGICDGACRRAIALAVAKHHILISEPILAEYRALAGRSKFKPQAQQYIRSLADDMARDAQHIDIISFIGPTHMGDPKDVIYVLTASIGGADAILTGDLRDFIESHYGGARVLSVRQFLDLHP